MIDTNKGSFPQFNQNSKLAKEINDICPSEGLNYPKLYKYFYVNLYENKPIKSKPLNHLLLLISSLLFGQFIIKFIKKDLYFKEKLINSHSNAN